jgi:hypothetical protein
MIFDPPTNDIFISSWERLVLYYSISVGFLQVLTFVTQQQIAEALGALNGATRRLRKTKSGFLSTTFLVSPLLYLFGLPNLPAKVSN